MANKALITVSAECFQAQKNKNGSSLVFTVGVKDTEKGPAARSVVNVSLPEQSYADSFTIGKHYNIVISAAE